MARRMVFRLKRVVIVVLVALSPAIWAPGCTTIEPFKGKDKIGLVLLHGKNSRPDRGIASLATDLAWAGVLVDAPLMPWGRCRLFDKDYESSMEEIDAAVRRLRARGAAKIVVGGQSLGANAALGYGARHSDVNGLILLAMGHALTPKITRIVGPSLARARTMIREGDGEKIGTFQDFNQGKRPVRKLTARIYLSWFDPDGPASTKKNASKIGPGIPVLWVSGDRDRITRLGKRLIFDHLPPHPHSKYMVISSTHRRTPDDAVQLVADWLRGLK